MCPRIRQNKASQQSCDFHRLRICGKLLRVTACCLSREFIQEKGAVMFEEVVIGLRPTFHKPLPHHAVSDDLELRTAFVKQIVFVDACSQDQCRIVMSSKIEQGFFDFHASVLGREDDDDCLRRPLPASSCVFFGPAVQEFRQDHGFAGSWRTADAADRVCFYACENAVGVVFDRQAVPLPRPWQCRKLAEVRVFRRDPLSPHLHHCA